MNLSDVKQSSVHNAFDYYSFKSIAEIDFFWSKQNDDDDNNDYDDDDEDEEEQVQQKEQQLQQNQTINKNRLTKKNQYHPQQIIKWEKVF